MDWIDCMKTAWRKYATGWIAAAVCAGVVLLAGTGLVVLSLHQTAAQMRTAAQRLADRDAGALQRQLQALSLLAERRAAAAADAAPPEAGPDEFWLGSDGKLLGRPDDYRIASDIAAAWSQPASASGARMLGPLREGSHWLVALRAPLRLPQGNGGLVPIGWSVVYRDLSELLVAAQLDRVTRAGYDFQLSRTDGAGRSVI